MYLMYQRPMKIINLSSMCGCFSTFGVRCTTQKQGNFKKTQGHNYKHRKFPRTKRRRSTNLHNLHEVMVHRALKSLSLFHLLSRTPSLPLAQLSLSLSLDLIFRCFSVLSFVIAGLLPLSILCRRSRPSPPPPRPPSGSPLPRSWAQVGAGRSQPPGSPPYHPLLGQAALRYQSPHPDRGCVTRGAGGRGRAGDLGTT